MIKNIKIGESQEDMNVGFVIPLAIYCAVEAGLSTKVMLHGGGWFYTDTPLAEIKKMVQEADENRFGTINSGGGKIEDIKFPEIEVGDKKFRVLIHTYTQPDSEPTISLVMEANFSTKDDILIMTIEAVYGVEEMGFFCRDKYKTHISIGAMFDPDTVRQAVEDKVKDFLQD